MIGGSEFDKSDFLSFAKKLKELTNKTYIVLLIDRGESELTECKVEMKELLDRYNKESEFDVLNEIVVAVANSNHYQEVANDDQTELYNFVGMTEKVLKEIEIDYVLNEPELDNIRNIMESSGSSSGSSSRSGSSARKKNRKRISNKSKKKHKSKKHKRRSNKSKKRKRRSKKSKKR